MTTRSPDPAPPGSVHEGPMMLPDVADDLLRTARGSPSGRAAHSLTPGAHLPLTQTVLALRAGEAMQEHTAPGPATIQVLAGDVTLRAAGGELALTTGDWSTIPVELHSVVASSDAVMLLTVARRPGTPDDDAA